MILPISLKTLANALGILLLIALVAPFVVYAVPGVIGAEHGFVVLTASMTPAIAPGDVVIVDERDPATIAEGDVITFVRGDNEVPVTHRVIGVTTSGGDIAFETQGDANGGPDASLVPGGNVLGVVAVTIPYIGYVIQFGDSPAGFALLVVAPLGLLLISELRSLVRNRDGGSPRNGSDAESEREGDADASGAIDDGEASPAAAATDPDPAGITVDTVVGAGAVLALFVPYSAYAALQLRTTVSYSVAIATAVLCLCAIAIWVGETGTGDRSGSRTAAEAESRGDPGIGDDSTGRDDQDDGIDEDDEDDVVDPIVQAASAGAPDDPTAVTDGSGEVDR